MRDRLSVYRERRWEAGVPGKTSASSLSSRPFAESICRTSVLAERVGGPEEVGNRGPLFLWPHKFLALKANRLGVSGCAGVNETGVQVEMWAGVSILGGSVGLIVGK